MERKTKRENEKERSLENRLQYHYVTGEEWAVVVIILIKYNSKV